MTETVNNVFAAIARSLREFGYRDVTPAIIEEVEKARIAGDALPHGIIGMFAKGQLEDAHEAGLLP